MPFAQRALLVAATLLAKEVVAPASPGNWSEQGRRLRQGATQSAEPRLLGAAGEPVCTVSASVAALEEELGAGLVVLNDGARMPRLGFGTAAFSDYRATNIGPLVAALKQGYRLLDTGVMYHNAKTISKAIKQSGLSASSAFISSKAWPFSDSLKGKDRSEQQPAKSGAELKAECRKHVEALGVGSIGLYLLHWPTSRLLEHWSALLELQREGLVRSIGLSNSNIGHLQRIERAGLPPPAVLQTSLSPLGSDPRIQLARWEELAKYALRRGIVLMSHSPIAKVPRGKKSEASSLAAELGS